MAGEKAVIRLTAQDDTRAGFASAQGGLDGLGTRAEGLNRTFLAMSRAIPVIAMVEGARRASAAFITAADKVSGMNARLALVTKSTQEFAYAQDQLFKIARNTRTGLVETSDLYGSLSRSTQALGVSQNDVLAVTQAINQSMVVSGASAQGAAAALVQLGQGFASGALRGAELNSVLLQSPRLAQAIADGLGVPLGKLKELGEQGELTADRVFKALRSQADTIGNEFARVPIIVSGAMQQMDDATLLLVANVDAAMGATAGLAGVISDTAKFVAELAREIKRGAEGAEDIGFWAEAFLTVSEAVRVFGSDVAFVLKGVGREIGGISAQMVALANLDFKGFTAIGDAMKEDAARAREELDKYQRDVLTRMKAPAAPMTSGDFSRLDRAGSGTGAPAGGDSGKKGADPYAAAIKSLKQQIALVGKNTELEKASAQIQLGTYGRLSTARAEQLRQLAATLDASRELQAAEEARLGLDLARIQRELAGVTSAFAASEAVLEAQRSAGAVADQEYFDARIGLLNLTAAAQVRALEAENTRLAAEKAGGAERIKNLERIADNEARIAQIRTEAAGQGQALEIQQAAALKAVATAYADAEAAAQSYLDTLRRQNQRQLDGMGLGSRERERLSGRTDIEDRYGEQLLQLESDRRNGLPQEQYQEELERIKRFQKEALSEWDTYFAARVAKERDASVGVAEAAANYVSEAQNIAKQTEDLFTSAFGGMEDALVSFVTTGKADFRGLADSIVADLTRMIIKQQVMLPLMNALGLGGGGGGGAAGGSWIGTAMGALFGGARAEGGPVAAGRAYMVGERGPEMIVPTAAGLVVPNDQLGGKQQTVNITQHFSVAGPVDRRTESRIAASALAGAQRALARNG